MKNIIAIFWNNFREDFELYITVAVAIPVAILNLFGTENQNLVFSLTLATIALISFGLLKNRKEDRNLKEMIAGLETEGGLSKRFLRQDFDWSRILNLVKNANKDVYFFGLGFTALIPILKDHLSHRKLDNIHMKFLLMDPHGNAVKVAAFRAGIPGAEMVTMYERNLDAIASIAKESSGRVEYRVIDYLPPYNIIAIDQSLREKGYMLVHLATWRTATADRPFFELSREGDQKWFEYFHQQFIEMWKNETEHPA